MLRVEKRKDISPSWTWNLSYLPFTTFGRIGFKSWGILTFGPFVLLLCLFSMSASSRLAHEQTSIHKYPILFHGCPIWQPIGVKVCEFVCAKWTPRWANGPDGLGCSPRVSDKDRWTPKSTSCDCSSCLRTSLISAQRQLTVFPSYSNEPEKPKKRRGGRLYVFFDGIGIERLKLKGFDVWLWLNKPCCLAVPAYHTRNCVIKCLRTKKSCRFYTRDHRSNLKTCFYLLASLIKVYFFQRFYKKYYVGN